MSFIHRFSATPILRGWVIPIFAVALLLLVAPSQAAPPQVPKDFDEATVRLLLERIDSGANAAVLKVGYFNGHQKFSLESATGFAMLESQLATEPKGTRRWYLYQLVKGWAGCHMGELYYPRALDAYNALFASANADASNAPVSVVQRASGDLVSWLSLNSFALTQDLAIPPAEVRRKGVPTNFEALPLSAETEPLSKSEEESLKTERVKPWKEALYRAFVAYILTLQKGDPILASPRWEGVVAWMTEDERFDRFLQKGLLNTSGASKHGLLLVAGVLNQEKNPPLSLTYLSQAKSGLPLQDKNQVRRYYAFLVDQTLRCIELKNAAALLSGETASSLAPPTSNVGNNKVDLSLATYDHAIAAQRERVTATGDGYARLALIRLLSSDIGAFEATCTYLKNQNADEKETVLAGKELLRTSIGSENFLTRAQKMGSEVLQAYLNSNRPRTTVNEWDARLSLSEYFFKKRDYSSARVFLGIGRYTPPSSSALRSRFDHLSHLLHISPEEIVSLEENRR